MAVLLALAVPFLGPSIEVLTHHLLFLQVAEELGAYCCKNGQVQASDASAKGDVLRIHQQT